MIEESWLLVVLDVVVYFIDLPYWSRFIELVLVSCGGDPILYDRDNAVDIRFLLTAMNKESSKS